MLNLIFCPFFFLKYFGCIRPLTSASEVFPFFPLFRLFSDTYEKIEKMHDKLVLLLLPLLFLRLQGILFVTRHKYPWNRLGASARESFLLYPRVCLFYPKKIRWKSPPAKRKRRKIFKSIWKRSLMYMLLRNRGRSRSSSSTSEIHNQKKRKET